MNEIVELPCIVCNKELANIASGRLGNVNQPMRGTEFIGGGCYGSRITDYGGAKFHINVCDDCLETALKEKKAYERPRK
jgi:hypothetical protein